ncbi:MAG: substrate-binding domain-containing protein [Xanthobacteraceae bacterium]
MTRLVGRVAAIAMMVIVQGSFAHAAELRLFSTIGVQGAVEELLPLFEKVTGNKVVPTWSTAAMLVKRIQGGETADLYILTRTGIDALAKEGKVVPSSAVTLASSGIALAVKAGAPKPNISTPEALKATLLNAKAVAYSDPAAGGASGVYFANLLERMGIADQMKAKAKFPPPGGNSASLLLTGEADIAVQQTPEIMYVKGVDIIGVLPGDYNSVTVFGAGIAPDSKNTAAADLLIKSMQSPEARAVFRSRGLDPS